MPCKCSQNASCFIKIGCDLRELQWGPPTPTCCPQLHLPNLGSVPAGRAQENKRPWDDARGPRVTPQKRQEGLPGPEIPGGSLDLPRFPQI